MFTVFVRNWWRRNPKWPGGREPSAGRRHTLAKHIKTEEEARYLAQRYNATHKPGFLSRKAEYTET